MLSVQNQIQNQIREQKLGFEFDHCLQFTISSEPKNCLHAVYLLPA